MEQSEVVDQECYGSLDLFQLSMTAMLIFKCLFFTKVSDTGLSLPAHMVLETTKRKRSLGI